jgi:putative hydrolase of the HAD superfamily
VFEHALAVVGAQPHEAWHIGDNLYADIRGAQQAGIHAAWIHRDRLTIGEDAPAKPDRIVGHLDEVRAALGV